MYVHKMSLRELRTQKEAKQRMIRCYEECPPPWGQHVYPAYPYTVWARNIRYWEKVIRDVEEELQDRGYLE